MGHASSILLSLQDDPCIMKNVTSMVKIQLHLEHADGKEDYSLRSIGSSTSTVSSSSDSFLSQAISFAEERYPSVEAALSKSRSSAHLTHSMSSSSLPRSPRSGRHECSKECTHDEGDTFFYSLYGPVFHRADSFVVNMHEREAFITFVDSGLWKAYIDSDCYESLVASSLSIISKPSSASSALSDPARQVVEEEMYTDGIVNLSRSRIEDCFTAEEMRSLCLVALVVCYIKYRDDVPESVALLPCTTLAAVSRSSDRIGGGDPYASIPYFSSPNYNTSFSSSRNPRLLEPLEKSFNDNTFFVDPIEVVQVTVCSTSRNEWDEILRDGSWVSLFQPLVDKLDLALTICEVVTSSYGVLHFPTCYTNHAFKRRFGSGLAAAFTSTCPPDAKHHDDVIQAWQAGRATKSKLNRSSHHLPTREDPLACCLPILDESGQVKFVVSVHQPMGMSLQHQATLRMADFLLYTLGSLLGSR